MEVLAGEPFERTSLVCFDGSLESQIALEAAIALQQPDTRIVLAYAVQEDAGPPTGYLVPGVPGPTRTSCQKNKTAHNDFALAKATSLHAT